MKKIMNLVAAGSLAVMTGCSSDDAVCRHPVVSPGEGGESVVEPYSVTTVKTTDRFEATDDEMEANDAVNSFAYRLALTSLSDASAEGERNVAVSPLGVAMALGLYANSTDETVEQSVCYAIGVKDLQVFNSLNTKLISYLGNPKLGGAVELANSVWYTKRVMPLGSYVSEMNKVYFADVNAADLSSREGLKVIDTWVNAKTHELIPTVSDMISPSLDLASVLVNALYFAGEWEKPFDVVETLKEPFHTDGKSRKCDMMHNRIAAGYTETETYEMVDFGFKGTSRISLVLPREGVSLEEVRESLGTTDNSSTLKGRESVDLNLGLPKFDIESMTCFGSTLTKMGCPLSAAVLKKMGLDERISGELMQKDLISVDEEGAKLSAVTVITFTSTGNQHEPRTVDLTFDRPFMFFIHNSVTGSIIMAGQVVEP